MLKETSETLVNSANICAAACNGQRPYQNTFNPQKAVDALYRRLGTWRAVAEELGDTYSPATWHLVARGDPPSHEVENTLRRYLRLPPRRVSTWSDMRTSDVSWYLTHRQEVCYSHAGEQAR